MTGVVVNDNETRVISVGIQGPEGAQGVVGPEGPAGSGGGFNGLGIWRYRTETSSPPASGQIRFNNADISAATEFYLHETNLQILVQDE